MRFINSSTISIEIKKGEQTMAFLVSLIVLVTEKVLTNVVPMGNYINNPESLLLVKKGPMDEITAISSEDEYVRIFINQILIHSNIFLVQPTFYSTETH